jgi:hypothetical protein
MSHLGLSGMSDKIVLKGDDAIALWKAGKDTWNQWAKENPEADVDFSGVKLSEHRTKGMPIDFTGYIFPNGNVSFSHAIFGDGHVSFCLATFGAGNVLFNRAMFGTGNVDFALARFSDGEVIFHGAILDKSKVNMSSTKLGNELPIPKSASEIKKAPNGAFYTLTANPNPRSSVFSPAPTAPRLIAQLSGIEYSHRSSAHHRL